MSARKERFHAQEVLERIWNDSGDEEDLDGIESSESEVGLPESASEDESEESPDSFSSNEGENVQDSEQNSSDKASDGGDGGSQVNRVRQRQARRQMAHGTIPRDMVCKYRLQGFNRITILPYLSMMTCSIVLLQNLIIMTRILQLREISEEDLVQMIGSQLTKKKCTLIILIYANFLY